MNPNVNITANVKAIVDYTSMYNFSLKRLSQVLRTFSCALLHLENV